MRENLFSNRIIADFCKGLSLLLHGGIALGDGLYLLAEEEEGAFRLGLEQMGERMDSGFLLSQAMEEHGGFPAYVVGMVKMGERTGHLEESLQALADYYEEREKMDRQLRNALAYPSLLLLLMLMVIAVLLIRVLPVFDEVYASLGGQLTGLAGGLLHLGQVLEAALPLLCILLATAAVFLMSFAVSENVRQKTLNRWNKNWGDKGVSKKINNARFAQALSMGLRSGLPVEEAVELAGELLQDVPAAAKRYGECAAAMIQGEALTHALRRTDALPPSACRMLDVGLRSGNGDAVMEEISNRLSEEATEALERRVAQVEPAMVMTASLLVGIILLSVMLPLMNIMSAIG